MLGESAAATSLAGGTGGAERLAELIPLALRGMAAGVAERGGPVPAGGPAAVAAGLAAAGSDAARTLPARGIGAERALTELSRLLAAGSADPADPACAAHLHCPPLAVSVAADVVASALNPSMDSWDQAPVASELEREFTEGIARLCYPGDYPGEAAPDAVVTSGSTESNLLGLLLARELSPGLAVRPVCGANAHHSVARAAWLLGLPAPVIVACEDDRMLPAALAEALAPLGASAIVVATAGTPNTGRLDPLPEIAALCRRFGARLHVDAAYGGMALFSPRRRPALAGLDLADSIALDMHKFGWQPVAAGLLACRAEADLAALTVRAEYLNADDDTEAGLPDLLGRSLRTSRRPDAFRMAVTVRALGTDGLGELVERCCDTATGVEALVAAHPGLRSWGKPSLSTVLFRPVLADALAEPMADALVAGVRRALLEAGTAVIGRASMPTGPDGAPQLWLKLTLLHPHTAAADYRELLDRVVVTAANEPRAVCAEAEGSPVAS
ncbi:pyridoxal phosphate-dependent decarboxylase family protein [Amycolatopsis sp. H20-H5]|uniref:pyridoxal phosphate-dependent decarboxylase family protein n=1 Tax=Amycolatopsis sp. H20-H5 TaxID=3046309 RepID=UPI002DBF154D|nr:aminotransferase class I/II-fold pyridoxal phosphate-dependent enzyme [Amycolatopsis sp. H20-H5]MEC3981111.1 aminotransferase class I/II-fold pyridoxal phosphate-dependent enzyme [Amycolatopsis sp. H20-H5]